MLTKNAESNSPAYLKWKCIDNFQKMDKGKMFFSGKYSPSTSMVATLEPIFEDIKKRYTKQINDLFFKPKKYLTLCSGQYTFFFVLPKMLKYLGNKYPLLPVHLVLDETRPQEVDKQDYDFIGSGVYIGVNEHILHSLKHKKYKLSRCVFYDNICLSSSNQCLKRYSSKHEITEKHEIIFYRYDEEIDKYYNNFFAPKSRINEKPKIVVDSYYMIYLLIKQDVGISGVLSSMNKTDSKSLMILQREPLITTKRLVFCKKIKQEFTI